MSSADKEKEIGADTIKFSKVSQERKELIRVHFLFGCWVLCVGGAVAVGDDKDPKNF